MRWKNYLVSYYNSHLFSLFSIWLGYTLYTVGHPVLGVVMIGLALLKLAGIYLDDNKLRKISLIGLNSIWGVGVYFFVSGHHPHVALSYHFPMFILLFGLGIGLRGRFNG